MDVGVVVPITGVPAVAICMGTSNAAMAPPVQAADVGRLIKFLSPEFRGLRLDLAASRFGCP